MSSKTLETDAERDPKIDAMRQRAESTAERRLIGGGAGGGAGKTMEVDVWHRGVAKKKNIDPRIGIGSTDVNKAPTGSTP